RVLFDDLLDPFVRHLPPVAVHDAGSADLSAGFGIKGVFLEDDVELITGLAKRERLGLGFRRLIADPFLSTLLLDFHPLAAAAPAPPLAAFRRRLSRRPRLPPLLPERSLEPVDVHRLPALGRDHLR